MKNNNKPTTYLLFFSSTDAKESFSRWCRNRGFPMAQILRALCWLVVNEKIPAELLMEGLHAEAAEVVAKKLENN